MSTVSPKSKLVEVTIGDNLTNTEFMDIDLPVSSDEPNTSTAKGEPVQPTSDSPENSETVNDIKNESISNPNESEETKEQIVGEITFTDPENTNSDSKGNLTIDEMPTGVSAMHLLETSSVISEPIDMGVPETIPTTSVTLNSSNLSLPCHTSDKSKHSAKKARLKSCIIKLTELSNLEHDKWLTSESGSSQTNISVESVESTSSSGS